MAFLKKIQFVVDFPLGGRLIVRLEREVNRMSNTVSGATIFMIGLNLVLGFVIPAVLCIVMRKKTGGSRKAFFVGCGIMLVFAFILEGAVNATVASIFGTKLTGNIWVYAIYGGFMAGLFEETGRFVAFKTLLKKNMDNDGNALMYGAGHGGFEAFYLLVFGMINNLIYAVMINAGTTAAITAALPAEQAAAMNQIYDQLITVSPLVFLASPVERLFAIMTHLGLSVIVWFAAKKGGKYTLLYPFAIFLHMFVDTTAVLINGLLAVPVVLVEAYVLLTALMLLVIARYVWQKCKTA